MGSNRKLVFGVLFVVAGLIFWGLFHVISNSSSTPPPPPVAASQISTKAPSGNQVAEASTDIPQGSIVTKGMLKMAPSSGPTDAYVTSIDDQALGFITSRPIPKNSKIQPNQDFVGHISETGVAAMLHSGTRALVIPIANKPTLHDLVHIGNFIDINAAFDGQEARTIVQNVRVLAVDVFGSDYPQTNVAVRGPYKADGIAGAGTASAPPQPAPGAPGATPTPTPAAAAAGAPRPDPSMTVEVTPEQANKILLAQASGGVIDFTVLPALPGGQTSEAVPVPGTPELVSEVTKGQIAPYAESKKHSGGNTSAPVRTVSTGGNTPLPRFGRPEPVIPQQVPNIPTTVSPAPIPENPTYEIPVYADGKLVRSDAVRRPQE